MKRAGVLALAGAATLLAVTLAVAQTQQQIDWCVDKDNTFSIDQRVDGCTASIQSGKWSGQGLAWAFNNRGLAYEAKGDHDRAIADFNEAIRLDPKYAPAFNNRGLAYDDKGDRDHAIADFNETIRLEPKYAIPFKNRGNVYHEKGDLDHAIADYSEAIRLDPKHTSAFNNRGNVYQEKGDHDHAIADYNEAIRIDPKYVFAFTGRGIVYDAKDDHDHAIAEYDEAIRLDPGYTAAFTHRGLAYEAKGDPERARADFNAALAKPQKYDNGQWAHDTARQHLSALGPAPAPVPPAVATVERRLALVIGNSAYKSAPFLPNPQRDADAVSKVLRQVGFQTVTLANDLTRDQLIDALHLFAQQAEGADWVLVYYAGHGIQMGGTNYLIPIDAKLQTARDVDFEAVPLAQVMAAVEGAKKLRLIILDACRDDPFANQMRRTSAGRSVARGLARVEPDVGTLIAYSAKEGEIALDDSGGTNSPFAAAFVKEIMTPGLEVRRLFDLVRDDVMETTQKLQQPFTYGSVSGREQFFFVSAR